MCYPDLCLCENKDKEFGRCEELKPKNYQDLSNESGFCDELSQSCLRQGQFSLKGKLEKAGKNQSAERRKNNQRCKGISVSRPFDASKDKSDVKDVDSAVRYNTSKRHPERKHNIEKNIQYLVSLAGTGNPLNHVDIVHVIARAQKCMGLVSDGKFGRESQKVLGVKEGREAGSLMGREDVDGVEQGRQEESSDVIGDRKTEGNERINWGTKVNVDLGNDKVEGLSGKIKGGHGEGGKEQRDEKRYERYREFGIVPYTIDNYAAHMSSFLTVKDSESSEDLEFVLGRNIAQFLIWAKEEKNPSLSFPVFQGAVYEYNEANKKLVEEDNGTILTKNQMKKILRGDAVIKSSNFDAFKNACKNIYHAHQALQYLGLQCNDVTLLMLEIAYGEDSVESKFVRGGFRGAMFNGGSNNLPTLDDRGIKEEEYHRFPINVKIEEKKVYVEEIQDGKVIKSTENGKLSGGLGRSQKLKNYAGFLHGKGSSAWESAKEGDFILEFQGVDHIENDKDLNANDNFYEDQFRHIAVILKIITYGKLKKAGGGMIVGGRTGLNDSSRLATTMGASSEHGVGMRDPNWKSLDAKTLDGDVTKMLWHKLDVDWKDKGISRVGKKEVRKVYLFKVN